MLAGASLAAYPAGQIMGRVGRRVSTIATKGFGMKVIYNDLLDVAGALDFPATPVDKTALYRSARSTFTSLGRSKRSTPMT